MPTYFAASSGNTFNTTRVTLLAADILALNTTPIMLVQAPGPGLWITPFFVIGRLNFNSVIYAGSSTGLLVGFNMPSVPVVADSLFTDNTLYKSPATNTKIISPVATGTTVTEGIVTNAPLYVGMGSSNPINGNSTLDIWVSYVINSN